MGNPEFLRGVPGLRRKRLERCAGGACLGLGVLLAIPPITASVGDGPAVTALIEEQSACRMLSGGYMLSFVLRTSYASSGREPIALAIEDQRVARALISWKDSEPVTFASAGGSAVDRAACSRSQAVTVRPGQPAESTVTAHVPLSTDPSDWPAALLPGDYRVQFALRVPAVDPSGTIDQFEAVTTSFSIRIPDPTAVQECPFDMAPRDLLVAG